MQMYIDMLLTVVAKLPQNEKIKYNDFDINLTPPSLRSLPPTLSPTVTYRVVFITLWPADRRSFGVFCPKMGAFRSFTDNVTIDPRIDARVAAGAGGGDGGGALKSAASTPGKVGLGIVSPSKAAEDSAGLASRLQRRKSRRDRKSRDVSAMLHRLSGVYHDEATAAALAAQRSPDPKVRKNSLASRLLGNSFKRSKSKKHKSAKDLRPASMFSGSRPDKHDPVFVPDTSESAAPAPLPPTSPPGPAPPPATSKPALTTSVPTTGHVNPAKVALAEEPKAPRGQANEKRRRQLPTPGVKIDRSLTLPSKLPTPVGGGDVAAGGVNRRSLRVLEPPCIEKEKPKRGLLRARLRGNKKKKEKKKKKKDTGMFGEHLDSSATESSGVGSRDSSVERTAFPPPTSGDSALGAAVVAVAQPEKGGPSPTTPTEVTELASAEVTPVAHRARRGSPSTMFRERGRALSVEELKNEMKLNIERLLPQEQQQQAAQRARDAKGASGAPAPPAQRTKPALSLRPESCHESTSDGPGTAVPIGPSGVVVQPTVNAMLYRFESHRSSYLRELQRHRGVSPYSSPSPPTSQADLNPLPALKEAEQSAHTAGLQAAAERLGVSDDTLHLLLTQHLPRDSLRISGMQSQTLTYLDISFGHLSNLAPLAPFVNLDTLVADNNDVSSLASLPPFENLNTLSVNRNQLRDLLAALGEIRIKATALVFLSLIGNPCCPMGLDRVSGASENSYKVYCSVVIEQLPGLRFLDSHQISQAAIDQANEQRSEIYWGSDASSGSCSDDDVEGGAGSPGNPWKAADRLGLSPSELRCLIVDGEVDAVDDPLLDLAELKLAAGVISKSEYMHILTIHQAVSGKDALSAQFDSETDSESEDDDSFGMLGLGWFSSLFNGLRRPASNPTSTVPEDSDDELPGPNADGSSSATKLEEEAFWAPVRAARAKFAVGKLTRQEYDHIVKVHVAVAEAEQEDEGPISLRMLAEPLMVTLAIGTSGPGLALKLERSLVTVISVLPGGAAGQAGLTAGDVLLKANGELLTGLSIGAVYDIMHTDQKPLKLELRATHELTAVASPQKPQMLTVDLVGTGLPWSTQLRFGINDKNQVVIPVTVAGTDLRAGDRIFAIEGTAVTPSTIERVLQSLDPNTEFRSLAVKIVRR